MSSAAVWNHNQLLNRFDDDKSLVADLMEFYIKETEGLLAKVNVALAADSSKDVCSIAHALKGQAATVFLDKVRLAAHALEEAILDGMMHLITPLYNELRSALEEAIEVVSCWLEGADFEECLTKKA